MYRLRELARKDIATINTWRNNPELIAFLGAPFRYINEEVDYKWFDSYMISRANTIRCAIVNDLDEPLGLISLTSLNFVNQTAELHIMIGDSENQGKGIGTFAVQEMLHHAFFNMNLRRIELGVLAENSRAQRLYEKCGFKKEGVKRQAVYKNGKHMDLWMYAILKDDTNKCSGGGNA